MGGQVGRGWASAHWKYLNVNPYDSMGPAEPILGTNNNFGFSSVIGGGQLGFNYQLGWFLTGLEAACAGAGFSDKKLNVVQSVFVDSEQFVKTDLSFLAMGTGRIGCVVESDWLIYAKGGYAGSRIKTWGETSPPILGLDLDWKTSKWHNGWVVGGGVEYMATSMIIVGVEYNYISLNSLKHKGSVSGGNIGPNDQVEHDVDGKVQTAVVRVNFLIW